MNMPLSYCVYILFSEKDRLLYMDLQQILLKESKNITPEGTKVQPSEGRLSLFFVSFTALKMMPKNRNFILKPQWEKKLLN